MPAGGDALRTHLDEIDELGYTVIHDVIEPELCDEIELALARLEVELGIVPADNLFEGLRTVRIYNLLAHGMPFEAIPVHPGVLPVVEGVLDDGVLVSSLSSIAIGPGEDAQMLHADDQLIPLPRPHVPIICNTMWAITDFTADNGATRLVPGSHTRAELPDPFVHHETIPAEMPRGSVLVWVGSLWHGGGANRTDSRRIGIAMNYCAGYIRQQENQQLGIPRDVAAQFGDRLQALVGYSVYRGLIGHIDKAHPKAAVLGVAASPDLVWDAARPR